MKQKYSWVLVGMIALLGVASAQTSQSGATEKAVAALENQWLKSEQTNDVDLAAPLLAEKFVSTSPDGALMTKAQAIADARATKYTSASYENVEVRVSGDTAIATGVFNAKGTDSSGKPLLAHDRWTDTWVKMPDGKWQCIASHDSHIK